MKGLLSATAVQIAWYIERDGARIASYNPDGSQTVVVPLSGGSATYVVPADMVDDLRRERDRAYRILRDRERAKAARDGSSIYGGPR